MTIKLYQHQIDAIEFIKTKRNILLWHEVGLGKTLSAMNGIRHQLAQIKAHPDPQVRSPAPKALVILPTGLVAQWRSEIYRLANDISPHVIYVPYSMLHKAKTLVAYYDIRIVVMDESHYAKSMDTQRIHRLKDLFQCLHSSARRFLAGRIIMLTGTPIPNSAAEMYTTFAILGADNLAHAIERLNNKKRYMEWVEHFTFRDLKRIRTKKKPKGELKWGAPKGVSNEEELHRIISPFTHYRTAAMCLDLPEDQEIEIDLGIDDDKLLKDANINMPYAYMALVERLSRAKTSFALEWIDDFVSNNPGERLVVFCLHKWPLEQIKNKFKDLVGLITGDLSLAQRDANIKAFNNGTAPILIGTYAAMSTGLNLQAACKSLYLGYPWAPKVITQAKGRTKRSGQTKRTLHFFLMSGENDKKVLRDLRFKEEGISKVENRLLNSVEVNHLVNSLI